jgi:hypothetical protein
MKQISGLNEDHKGGSFVYIPWNNSIYCISGISSVLCEKLKLNKYHKAGNSEWIPDSKLENPRAYYATYVQNDHNIFIIFGFNFFMKEIASSIQKYDTKQPNAKWVYVLLKSEEIPKLIFATCIPSTDNEFYVLGGKDNLEKDNYVIYWVNLKAETIVDSNLRMPSVIVEKEYAQETSAKNIFYQENHFVALRRKKDNFETNFLFGLFDSKNFLHVVNVRNFDYSFVNNTVYNIHQEDNQSDSDEEYDAKSIEDESAVKEEMKNQIFK